jgi:hypothetical protein
VDPKAESISIETEHIQELPTTGIFEEEFTQYSKEFSSANTAKIMQSVAETTLSLDKQQMEKYIPLLTEGAHALFYGDQEPQLSNYASIFRLISSNDQDEIYIGSVLLSMWQEIPPQDNNLSTSMP